MTGALSSSYIVIADYYIPRVSFQGDARGIFPLKIFAFLECCGFIMLTKGKSVCMIYIFTFESFIKRQKQNSIQLHMYLKYNFSI